MGFMFSQGTLFIVPYLFGSIMQLLSFIISSPNNEHQSLPNRTPYDGGKSTTMIVKIVVI